MLIVLTSEPIKNISILSPDLVTTNNPELSNLNIPTIIIPHTDYKDREKHDLTIKETLDEFDPDKIILVDYNRIIKSKSLLKKYHDKIINIHLSYLPEFPGYKAHEQAWKAKTKESGFTFHRINGAVDDGDILYQEKVNIQECKSPEEIKTKLLNAAIRKMKELIATL